MPKALVISEMKSQVYFSFLEIFYIKNKNYNQKAKILCYLVRLKYTATVSEPCSR